MAGPRDPNGTTQPPPEPRPKAPAKERARLIGAVVLVALMLAFIFDNRHSVRVGFVFTDKQVPLIVVLVVTAVLGGVIDRLLRWATARRKRAQE